MEGDSPSRYRFDIGRVHHTLDGAAVDAVLDHHLLEGRSCNDGLADNGVLPGDGTALRISARLDAVDEHRAIVAAADIVLARPNHLDRNSRRQSDLYCLA